MQFERMKLYDQGGKVNTVKVNITDSFKVISISSFQQGRLFNRACAFIVYKQIHQSVHSALMNLFLPLIVLSLEVGESLPWLQVFTNGGRFGKKT